MFARLLFLTESRSRSTLAVELALAAVGISCGSLALVAIVGVIGVVVAGALGAALLWAAGQARGAFARTVARLFAFAVFGFIAYEALAFGAMLAWAVPWWGFALASALALACALPTRVRVHFVVPLGVLVLLCLRGWRIEDSTVRCEDHKRVVSQGGVELLVPSVRGLEHCVDGSRARPTGHPRKLFAAGDRRFFATVQLNPKADEDSTFDGGLCEVVLESTGARMQCRRDMPRLYGLAYRADTNELVVGEHRGLVRLSGAAPFETLAHADVGEVAMINYEPSKHRYIAFFDDMSHVATFDDGDLHQLDSQPLHVTPEEFRYAPDRREGLYCFASTPLFPLNGRGFLSLAVGADLLALRPLGTSPSVPWSWLAFSDGCDFDPSARTAYVGVGTLGLTAVVDYDSGALSKTFWVGFGVRPLLLERRRNRLYAGNYLDGWVRELDATTGKQLRAWFVGRFVRHIVPDPRGDALLVTSTLGIVRISLG